MSEVKFDLKPVESKPSRQYRKGSKYDPILDTFMAGSDALVAVSMADREANYLRTQLNKRIDARNRPRAFNPFIKESRKRFNIPRTGDIVFLKGSSDDGWTDYYEIGDPRCIEFTWTSPSDACYCNTFVVQLKKGVGDDPYKPKGPTYLVEGTLDGEDKPAHLRLITAYTFGTAMTILSTFSCIGAYSKSRKNSHDTTARAKYCF